ncbi:MAG: glycosyltransferase family 4 protein [Cyanobacteria bacterium P01_G01_bin.39]
MNKTLRIACYGRIDKNSVSSMVASYHMVEELLKRGHEIDYYGEKDYMYPEELLKYSNFQHFEIPLKSPIAGSLTSFINNSPLLKGQASAILKLLFSKPLEDQALAQAILANHQIKKYDLLFFADRYSPCKVKQLPAITWVPDPTDTEWYFIRKQRKSVIDLCGIGLYLKKKAFCTLKNTQRRLDLKKNSDLVICGSQWARKEHLTALNFQPEMVKALPYTVDTEIFHPQKLQTEAQQNNQKTFLWLGRIEPRKRFDLLLDAYRLILQERQDIKLKIVGQVKTEFAGYKKLLDRYEYLHLIDYQPSIERSKVPELMAQCDALIQPSEGENFGTSVAEALCCGLPVIVGATNGTKDFISASSFVFDDYNAESLKKTMLQAVEAIERNREKLAVDARETAEKNFSVSMIVDNLEDIFQEVIELKQQKSQESSETNLKPIIFDRQ